MKNLVHQLCHCYLFFAWFLKIERNAGFIKNTDGVYSIKLVSGQPLIAKIDEFSATTSTDPSLVMHR